MATTILPEQVRGTMPFTELTHVNAGTPRNFDFGVICTNWMTDTGHLMFWCERSLDGKQTWIGFGASDKTLGTLGKGATQAIQIANAKKMGVFWDGQAMDVRVRVDVSPAPFAWGLEAL